MAALFNPWALLALVVAWAASIGGTAWYFDGNGEARAVARQARDDEVRKATFDAAQAGAAAAIAKGKVRTTIIRQETQREIASDPRYSDPRCALTDGVFQRANEALTGRPQSAGDVRVP